jgi:hypothetical protein
LGKGHKKLIHSTNIYDPSAVYRAPGWALGGKAKLNGISPCVPSICPALRFISSHLPQGPGRKRPTLFITCPRAWSLPPRKVGGPGSWELRTDMVQWMGYEAKGLQEMGGRMGIAAGMSQG